MDAYFFAFEQHGAPIFAVFLAAFLQSVTGFGLVIVAAPLLMLFYESKLVVPIMLLLASCGNSVQGWMERKQANFALVKWLYLGVLLGQPLGFFVFYHAPNDVLKLFINVVLLVSLSLLQISHRHINERRRNSLITGIFSGFTSITTGMGGPPFLIYLAYTQMTTRAFRATCFVFFFLCNITSLTSYLIGGFPLQPALTEFPYLLPALIVGIILGHLLFRFIPGSLIKKIVFALLYITSLWTIFTVLQKNFF